MKPHYRRRRRIPWYVTAELLLLTLVAVMAFFIFRSIQNFKAIAAAGDTPAASAPASPGETPSGFQAELEKFAADHGLQPSDWPEELLELGRSNPEAADFVLQYPLAKEIPGDDDCSAYLGRDSVPLLMQWDPRWGYIPYAGSVFGRTGCGPACLSMVCLYLLNDPKYSPAYMAAFSREHGFSTESSGSSWTLISEGGEMLGLDVTEIPLDENRILKNLEVGNPIICIMGPGDFTSGGHFIVITGLEDGMLRINDPNSRARSEKLWEYAAIKDQIRNLWVCRV